MQALVFSSSCTVYGEPERVPIDEDCKTQAVSPYGRTKLYIEKLLRDVSNSDESYRFVVLRYFNPVAAHPSGEMGEHPIGVPQNLMPFIQQVAAGQRPELKVFGDDYNTRDGTAIRDYIHVMDLADSHVAGAPAATSLRLQLLPHVCHACLLRLERNTLHACALPCHCSIDWRLHHTEIGQLGVQHCNERSTLPKSKYAGKRSMSAPAPAPLCLKWWQPWRRPVAKRYHTP